MKNKFTLYSVLGIMALSAIVFTHTLVTAVLYSPVAEASFMSTSTSLISSFAASAAISSTTISTYPSRLLIPSLNINANVQKVGVKKDGSMGTPNNFTDVAWYKYGVIPGDLGSAVIDGHVDNGLALAGVFKHLINIKTGDDIYVVNAAGKSVRFIVTAIDLYNYKFVPVEDIFNNKDGSHLRLVTCNGTWVPIGKTYDERLVVTAILATTTIAKINQ